MGILLYEDLPLRKSGALGDFADEFVLAHRLGDLTSGRFKLERMSDTEWFAADHVMSIAQVFAEAQRFDSWEQRIRTDASGRTYTVVELASPAPPDAQMSATGTGKRHERTGALIENPADIAEYIGSLAGRADRWWDELRGEAAETGLRLAGSLDRALPIGEWYDAVCDSAGAIWCQGMARLYPADPAGCVEMLHASYVKRLVLRAAIENTGDVLRLYYDPDKASGKSQHYIELEANPRRYDGFAITRSLDWLRSPRNAEAVGLRLLPWLAGKRWEVTFDCEDTSVAPGQWRQLVAHRKWPFPGEGDPVLMILEVKAQPNSKTLQVVAQTLSTSPAVRVTGHSVALPTTRDAGIEQRFNDGKLTYVLRDENDRLIVGASVSLDRGAAKKTNAAGEVVFTSADFKRADPPVEHELAIQAPGMQATSQSVWL
ncbi:MAG: hypothetical protein ABI831_06855 [Betaproteobacteria bacterium]